MKKNFFFLDDHSRVHLTPVEGVPDSDYINASFINVRNFKFLSLLPRLTIGSKRLVKNFFKDQADSLKCILMFTCHHHQNFPMQKSEPKCIHHGRSEWILYWAYSDNLRTESHLAIYSKSRETGQGYLSPDKSGPSCLLREKS